MNVTLIAAVGKNLELGRDNDLIWKIPKDLKFFKENTINKVIVMGINTFKSLPKPLPNRHHIVITHQDIYLGNDIVIFHSLNELLTYINGLNEEVMVIGGAGIYHQMIGYADKMLLTEIDDSSYADVYFPKFNKEDWDRLVLKEDNDNGINYKHVAYTRKLVRK